jgi:tetratricopeptide (TPR) repeat protein
MNRIRPKQTAVLAFTALMLLAGCRTEPKLHFTRNAPVDLQALMVKAAELKLSLVVLVAESGQSRADEKAFGALEFKMSEFPHCFPIVLDIGNSRNRATAARFHIVETPVLLCLSPEGIIISRDEAPITRKLALKRMNELRRQAPEVDARLDALKQAAAGDSNNAEAKFQLTDFLLAHHNALEAIPYLDGLAHSESSEPAIRIHAWVELGRAHLWIGEAEKARNEANALIATLGAANAGAMAGGKYVLALQDAGSKRYALARQEFQEAISAAPRSDYGKQAAAAQAALPKNGK